MPIFPLTPEVAFVPGGYVTMACPTYAQMVGETALHPSTVIITYYAESGLAGFGSAGFSNAAAAGVGIGGTVAIATIIIVFVIVCAVLIILDANGVISLEEWGSWTHNHLHWMNLFFEDKVLVGTSHNDEICGGKGDDVIKGEGGSDTTP